MDPLLVGVIVFVAAPAAAATARWIRGMRANNAAPAPKPLALTAQSGDGIRIGTVVTHLGETYWLAGCLSLRRDGSTLFRVFLAPEQGQDRWVIIPRDDSWVWIVDRVAALESMGFPGVEVPYEGRVLRRAEHGQVGIEAAGEGVRGWEGLAKFGVFRSVDRVALFIERADRKHYALVGREVPRSSLQTLG
ncbi:MAG: DUF4178 domain-containing protein [Deltaproteobacteria bacterium]|nr:DUF4178 domain-containing protein [Deltaproteobacteria bacterium]